MAETRREDKKIRLLGGRSFVGDQEILGELRVKDDSRNLIFYIDPDNNLVRMYNTAGEEVFRFDTASGLIKYYDTAGGVIYQFDSSDGKATHYDVDGNDIFIIDPTGETVTIKDDAGNIVWQVNTASGEIDEGYSWGDTAHRVDAGPRQWTTNNTWTNINQSIYQIDGDSFKNVDIYFEALMCVETAGRTVYVRMYDVTNSQAVPNSEISSTNVSSEAAGWMNAENVRSSSPVTLASGLNDYKLQFKQNVTGGAGDSAQFFRGALVYKEA